MAVERTYLRYIEIDGELFMTVEDIVQWFQDVSDNFAGHEDAATRGMSYEGLARWFQRRAAALQDTREMERLERQFRES